MGMGFYIDLAPVGFDLERFEEGSIPSVFWVLYAITGFALLCMGLAAHSLLGDLAKMGSGLDLALVFLILSAVPVYVLIGFKLGALRRFVSFSASVLPVLSGLSGPYPFAEILPGSIPLASR